MSDAGSGPVEGEEYYMSRVVDREAEIFVLLACEAVDGVTDVLGALGVVERVEFIDTEDERVVN